VHDVPVVGIIQRVVVDTVLRSVDLRTGERTPHLFKQVPPAIAAVVPAPLRIQAFQDVVQLNQDSRAPQRGVGLFGRELQQEIALPARHQGTGVEHGEVHAASLTDPSGGYLRRRAWSSNPATSLTPASA
jgi:hypothetical protein